VLSPIKNLEAEKYIRLDQKTNSLYTKCAPRLSQKAECDVCFAGAGVGTRIKLINFHHPPWKRPAVNRSSNGIALCGRRLPLKPFYQPPVICYTQASAPVITHRKGAISEQEQAVKNVNSIFRASTCEDKQTELTLCYKNAAPTLTCCCERRTNLCLYSSLAI
jgi:hypothetical protein